MLSGRILTLHLGVAFALTWGLQLIALALAGDPESAQAAPWLVGAMFTPGIVTLILIVVHRPARATLLWRLSRRSLPLLPAAVIVPTLIAFGVTGIAIGLGWGKPGWFGFSAASVTVTGGPWILGLGVQG